MQTVIVIGGAGWPSLFLQRCSVSSSVGAGKLWVILVSLAVALTLVLGPDTRDIITAAAQPDDKNWTNAEHAVHGFGLTVLILLIALAFIYPKVFSGAQAIARFIGDPRAEAAGGSIDSVPTNSWALSFTKPPAGNGVSSFCG